MTIVGHDVLLARLGSEPAHHQEDVPRLQPLRLLLPTTEGESVSDENITFTAAASSCTVRSCTHRFEIDAIAVVHEPVSTA